MLLTEICLLINLGGISDNMTLSVCGFPHIFLEGKTWFSIKLLICSVLNLK